MVTSDTGYLIDLEASKIAEAGQLAKFLSTPAPNVGSEKDSTSKGVLSSGAHARMFSGESKSSSLTSKSPSVFPTPNHGVPYTGNRQGRAGSQPDEARSSVGYKNRNC